MQILQTWRHFKNKDNENTPWLINQGHTNPLTTKNDLQIYVCLSSVFYYCDKVLLSSTSWLGDGLFQLTILRWHTAKVSQVEAQTRQRPEGKSWCRGSEGVLLSGLLSQTCSAWFPPALRTVTAHGCVVPTPNIELNLLTANI